MAEVPATTTFWAALAALAGSAVTGFVALSGAPVALIAVSAALTGFACVLAASGALALGRTLRDLETGMRRMAGGDWKTRGYPSGAEDRAAVGAFNEMAAAVEKAVASASQDRSRLTAALDSSVDAVVAVDAEGRVTYANAAAQRLFGARDGDIIGKPFGWVLPDQQVVEVLRASREEGRSQIRLIERPQKQYFQVFAAPIVGGGEWVSLLALHDLTEVKRMEQVRRDFIANVSHELRTPLSAIKSVIETLRDGALDDPGAARDFLDRADAEVDRLVQIVEELLELSRIESGEAPLVRQPVDVEQIVRNAVERLRPQAERGGLRLEYEALPGLPEVRGDAVRLERVVANLIHNAVKFTPEGGSINVRVAPADGGVRVSVEDTGLGILREDLPRVFERFYKVDRARGGSGTGLGLAVAKHTVEVHGGLITVTSEPGKGSVFSFVLPAGPAEAAAENGGQGG
jgi:two-component system phosphate regulon sensor histidine kinase PhoR